LINGPGTYAVEPSPNGFSTGSTGTGTVDLEIQPSSGSIKRVRKTVTFGTPETTRPPTTLPCGGTPDIDVYD